MSAEGLYDHLYAWVNKVLNTDLTLSIPIIKSHQNAPAPTGKYVAISFAPIRTREGRPGKSDPDSEGIRKLYNDYTLQVELWEVNGDGDLLRILLDSTDKQDVMALFDLAGFASISQLSPIQNLSSIEGKFWRHEHMVELQINAVETTEDVTGLIENVAIDGTVPPEGSASETHHIILGG